MEPAARDFVRTGERGEVVEVNLPQGRDPGSVVVDFARRGQVVVRMEYLTRRLDSGVIGALAHSYALTTHAAEGDTYDAARPIATDASSAKGLYVGVTRGEHDLRLYLVLERDFDPMPAQHPEMPRLDRETSTLSAVAAQVRTDRDELLATEIDPLAAQVAALRRSHTLRQLDEMTASSSLAAPLARRAVRQEEQAIAVQARLRPTRDITVRLGSRPAAGPTREAWDAAVGHVAVYRTRYSPTPERNGAGVAWALGPVANEPARQDAYSVAANAITRAEQAILRERTPAQLAQERTHLRSALATPSPQRLEHASEVAKQAREALDNAEARYGAAVAAQRSAERSVLRRPGARRMEAAAVDVSAALATRTAAADALRRATERVDALAPEAVAEARLPLQQRLERVEAAIASHVAEALAKPADYLTTALGPRPSEPGQRDRWNEAARQLENWRHAELGLGPIDGPLADEGLSAAIGPAPDDPMLALRRDMAVHDVRMDFSPTRMIDRELDGPLLELD